MALHEVKVTRLELARIKARRKIAEKGLALLKSKRGALITEFFKQAIRLQDLNVNVANETEKAMESMKIAEAYNGRLAVEMAAVEQQKANVSIKVSNIMGIKMPDIQKSRAMQTNSYEVAFFPSAIADAKNAYEKLFSFLIDIAEKENALRKLLHEIEKLNKRANTIEKVTIPKLDMQAKYIEQRMDDMDRDTIVMLKFVKKKMVI